MIDQTCIEVNLCFSLVQYLDLRKTRCHHHIATWIDHCLPNGELPLLPPHHFWLFQYDHQHIHYYIKKNRR